MIDLLIVDDEKSTREGLMECIDWKSLGVCVVGAAANGQAALSLTRQLKPQIVITDVRMPKMDGIAYAQEIRKIIPSLRIIFISGYTDVEYLKSAFKCDAVDYVFKPIDKNELTEVIRSQVQQIREEEQKTRQQAELEQKLADSIPFLREQFCRELLSGMSEESRITMQRLRILDLSIRPDDRFAVLICRISSGEERSNKTEKEKGGQAEKFSVQEMLEGIIQTQGFCVPYEDQKYVCVVTLKRPEKESREEILRLAEEIHRRLREKGGIANTIGIGRAADGICQLKESLKDALRMLTREFLYGSDCVIPLESGQEEGSDLLPIPRPVFERLSSDLLKGDSEGATTLIREELERLRRGKASDYEAIRSMCLQIASCLVSSAGRVPDHTEEFIDRIRRIPQEVYDAETLDLIGSRLLETAESIAAEVGRAHMGKSRDIIEKIRTIIDTRYQENLSVALIAKEVYMTPAYICQLFKQETGMTINQYLTDVRIRQAQKYLQDGDCKVSEVAAMSGYHDQKYFSKLFKKYVGVKPSEYR